MLNYKQRVSTLKNNEFSKAEEYIIITAPVLRIFFLVLVLTTHIKIYLAVESVVFQSVIRLEYIIGVPRDIEFFLVFVFKEFLNLYERSR